MNYASFYGGRPGAPFVIIRAYPSINNMITAFKEGDSYTEVGYQEYVIIDAENKNNPDNGKIFQRGYNYTDDLGGAIYIGQIVGPSGQAPALELKNYSEIKTHIDNMSEDNKKLQHPKEGSLIIDTEDLVPGKTPSGEFNDSINWASYIIRDSNNKDTIAYLGFQIPYLQIEAETYSVLPYDENSGKYVDKTSVFRIDDCKHPFYQKFQFNISKGITGDSFKNLRVETINQNSYFENYVVNKDDYGKDFLVYTAYDYSKYINGSPKQYCLGRYNIIKDILMDDNGTITIEYTGKDNVIFDKKIKWVKNINISTTGEITTEYNTGERVVSESSFIFPSKILFDNEDTQTIEVQYSNGKKETISNPINSIVDTVISPDYHLLLLHSDPEKREAIKAANQNYQGNLSEYSDYQDMGSIKDDDGLLIGLNLDVATYPDLGTQENAIEYLKENFPNGLEGNSLTGKIVTIGSADGNKDFYAFNYTKKEDGYVGWYYLGSFSNQLIAVGEADENGSNPQANELVTGGIWFLVEEW